MNRRKFLKMFGIGAAVIGSTGCVATYNDRDMKVDKDYVAPEKKHFERPLVENKRKTYWTENELRNSWLNGGGPNMGDLYFNVEKNNLAVYAFNGEKWIEFRKYMKG